jgi:glycosyltransferase involved in cell wall biosynthesis
MNKILFLGRICEAKGVKELLEAGRLLHAENGSIRLYIGGIYEDSWLEDEIKKCSGFAEYIGWVSGKEKDRYLDECGIMAVPSYFEGFGLTVIEGMLHGCCVVASNVGGIPDIIENEVDGLMIPPKDSGALKNALRRVMDDRGLADRLSGNGVRKAVTKYSIEKLTDRLVEMYRSMAGK